VSSKVKNYLIALLALSTAFTGLIALQQSRRLAALQEDLLKASAAATAVKPKSAPVGAEFKGTTNAKPAAADAAESDPAAGPADQPDQQRQQRNNRPNFAALLANPEFAQAMSVQQRAALDGRYAELFKQLNLSPEELEKFKSLLVERQNARMDVMNAARENGLNPRENRDELRKLTAEAQAEVDTTIKTTLGESVYNQYQNYESTQSQRAVVSQLDQKLSYSSTPLNSTQSAFLVNALAASVASTETADQGGGGPGNWGGRSSGTTITDDVIQQAQSVLTSDQVTALKQIQTEQLAQQQIRSLMRSNAGAEGGNNNRPPPN
jgi:hypothetical protein